MEESTLPPLLVCADIVPPLGPSLRDAIERPIGRNGDADLKTAARMLADAGYEDYQIFGLLANPANPVHAWAATRRHPERFVAQIVQTACSRGTAADRNSNRTDENGNLESLDLRTLAGIRPRPKDFAIDRLVPLAEVTLFTGPGSGGKSLLAQQFATASAAGINCLKLRVMPAPSIYLTCEDDGDQLHWRQKHICDALGVPMENLADKLHLISLRGELDNALGIFERDGTLLPTPAFDRLERKIIETGARHVWLDNVAHLFAGNENDRGDVTRFVNLNNRLAGRTGAAVVLLGHPNKSGDDYSGSTAWLNAVRSQFNIEHDIESDIRTLKIGKANYARKGDAFRFFWKNWAFVHEDDLPADVARELQETARAGSDNKLFLACLAERNKQRRPVSEKPTAQNFAPKIFDKMPESKGIGRKRLVDAMDRLFRIAAIERGFLWRDTAEGKDIVGLREAPENAGSIPETSPETCRKHIPETSGDPQE